MDQPDERVEVAKKLEERKQHLEEVKGSYLKAQDQLPIIQQNIDMTDWELRAYKDAPPEASEIPNPLPVEEVELENRHIMGVYKVLKIPSEPELYTTTSSTTSGTMSVFTFVDRVKDLGTPLAIQYGNSYITEYQDLQKAQARALLTKINTGNLPERFELAFQAYQGFRAGSVQRTAAANEIRNLLHALKGDLWAKARKWHDENMTWDKMSARLAINGGNGTEHLLLSRQETTHSSLLKRLAPALKDYEGGSVSNLDSIWTEVLDHLYTILGLIV